jgi:hypothetical protein
MKNIFLFLTVMAVCFSSQAIDRGSIVIISPEKENFKHNDNTQLWRRIGRLEQAVSQLQQQVFQLSTAPVVASGYTTCYIETPFDGTFSETSPTMTAAKAGAITKCTDKTKGSIYCSSDKVKCGN